MAPPTPLVAPSMALAQPELQMLVIEFRFRFRFTFWMDFSWPNIQPICSSCIQRTRTHKHKVRILPKQVIHPQYQKNRQLCLTAASTGKEHQSLRGEPSFDLLEDQVRQGKLRLPNEKSLNITYILTINHDDTLPYPHIIMHLGGAHKLELHMNRTRSLPD